MIRYCFCPPLHMEEQLIQLAHVALAAVLGGIVGVERESKDKPAGFRTNMIISSACALLIILGETAVINYLGNDAVANDFVETDPIRVIQAIVIGVGFIGAGSILKSPDEEKILYLTTAATILLSASVGIAIALRQYVLGIGIVLMVLIINRILNRVSRKLNDDKF